MPGSMSPAGILLMEDTLKKMMHKNGSSLAADKAKGLLPRGSHSCFGDFPPDLLPERLRPKVRARPQSAGAVMQTPVRSQSEPTLSRPQSASVRRPQMDMRRTRPMSATLRLQIGPPKAGAYRRQPIKPSMLRTFYERGDLPAQVDHGQLGKVHFKVPVEQLDYFHFLPIFFDGLREKEDPYRFMAVAGAYELLEQGGDRILPVVPQLVLPLKAALNTRDPQIMCTTLKIMQKLVLSGDMIGEALVPYYRQILQPCSIFIGRNIPAKEMGDYMDYGQRKNLNLGDLITETLQMLEEHGGEDAYINLKYVVPTYESAMLCGV